MLQRKQTLYIIFAIIFIAVFYFGFTYDHKENPFVIKNSFWLICLTAATLLLNLYAIVKFKNRQLQFVLNRLAILLNFVLLGVCVYGLQLLSGEEISSMKGIWLLLPIISIVFLVMANKAIKRDEELVKSVDRLR